MSSPPAIRLEGVHKRYRVYRERYRSLKDILVRRRLGQWEDHWVLAGVDLEVPRGATFGLVGPNGAGKSTTLKLISRILVPDRGTVSARGRVSALIELGAGFHMDYTGRENIFLNASLLGLSQAETRDRLSRIIDFSELGSAIDDPVRTYSSGMYMRLGFSVAINVEPDIMLVDEILAVGDEAFQRKCFDHLESFQRGGGTIVLISHNLASIRELCSEAAWIEDGRIRLQGEPREVVDSYLDSVREQRGRVRAVALDGAHRHSSSSPFTLGEARLLNDAGEPVQEIPPGATLAVELEYRVHQPVKDPMFGLMLWRNDGVLVYATNSHVDGFDLGPLDRDGRVRITFPCLRLLPGTYRLTTALFASTRPNAVPTDFQEERYSFRVKGKSDEQGVVRPQHEWSVGS